MKYITKVFYDLGGDSVGHGRLTRRPYRESGAGFFWLSRSGKSAMMRTLRFCGTTAGRSDVGARGGIAAAPGASRGTTSDNVYYVYLTRSLRMSCSLRCTTHASVCSKRSM